MVKKNNAAAKGDLITFPFATRVTVSDKLYKIMETEYA